MFVIGITGGIGCGKSTLSRCFTSYGVTVLDADEISRACTAPKGKAIKEIRETFGDEVIAPDGGVDRKKMADLVFSDRNKVDQLSAIVHRVVIDTIEAQLKKLTKAGEKLAVLDVPIPVKQGFIDKSNYILVVSADENVRVARLEGRGMNEAEARRRMRMQMSREEYESLADEVFVNNGGISEVEEFVKHLMETQLEPRGISLKKVVVAGSDPELEDQREAAMEDEDPVDRSI